MDEDRFSIWLSMAARDRPIKSRMRAELGRSGFWRRVGTRPNFSGIRIGRGAGVGRVLAMRAAAGRRVVTDARVIRLQRSHPTTAVRGHLRYLVRSQEIEARRPLLYGPDSDAPDRNAFARACRDDRHQFRMVVGAEDGCEYDDLRPLVRRLMKQVARDLRTPLDWVAADHFDTAMPHSHIVLRGVDSQGGDLVIAREYIEHGISTRAAELVNLDLGPAQTLDITRSTARRLQIAREGPTPIDRDLIGLLDEQGRVFPDHPDRWRQADRMGRLQTLQTLGLAHPDTEGRWYVQPDLVARLGEIEWRNRTARSRDRAGPALADDIDVEPIRTPHERDAIGEIGLDDWLRNQAREMELEPVDRHFQTLAQNLKVPVSDHEGILVPRREQDRSKSALEPPSPGMHMGGTNDADPERDIQPISRLIRQQLNGLELPYDRS